MSNAVAQQGNAQQLAPIDYFRQDLDRLAPEFSIVLPQHIPVDRFKRVALTAAMRNPDILRCDTQSLLNACVMAAQDGLLPDGREGALVEFKGKVQWMPMVYGIIKKMRNSGELASITAHPVYERDHFEYVLGDEERIDHKPTMGEVRGKMIAAYCIARLKDGSVQRKVMTRADIEKRRKVSRAQNGPWNTWYEEMAVKTVVRGTAKLLPMSTEVERVLSRDDALFASANTSGTQIAGPAPNTAAGQLSAFSAAPVLEHQASGSNQEDYIPPETAHPLVDTEGEVIFETTSSQQWMAKFEEALKITCDPVGLWKVNETALEWAADMLDGGDETMLRLRQTYLEKPAETAPADDWELELEQLQDGARACKTIPDLNAYKIEVGKRLQALPEPMFERWQSFSKTLAAELKGAK